LITLYSLYLLTIFLIYKLGYELLESIRNTFSLNIKNNRISTNLILGFLFLNFLALILNFFTALNDYLSLTILFLLLLILILRLNRRDIKNASRDIKMQQKQNSGLGSFRNSEQQKDSSHGSISSLKKQL
jgi:DNA integrity scanning protein DisA with diadenylate cyclase activity